MARKVRPPVGGASPRSGPPEARLDDKMKAMFEAVERRSSPNLLPDLDSLPKARGSDTAT